GSAVYDEHVGLSRTTGQVTHVTAADVDAERDYLFRDLEATGDLAERYVIDGFHKVLQGKNGGGDPWHTDGNLYVGIIDPKVSSKR
ncbi:MAG: LssY C-terminal domain-containing protein, partial [Gemmataceae bacterium]